MNTIYILVSMEKIKIESSYFAKRKAKIFYGSLVVLLCVCWGIGNPMIKIGLNYFPPYYMLGIRFIFAFIIFLLLFRKKIFESISKHNIIPCIIIGLLSALTYIFATLSLKITEASIAGFLMSIAVIFTPFLSHFMLKKKTDKRIFLLIAVVVAGTYFLCGNGGSFSFGWGELFAVLSSVMLAFVMILTSKHVVELGAVTLSSMQVLISGIFCFVIGFMTEPIIEIMSNSLIGWGTILYQAIFGSVITYLIQNVALKNLSPVFVSITFCLEPIFTAFFSFVMLGELLSSRGYLGGVLIVAGIIFASLLEE